MGDLTLGSFFSTHFFGANATRLTQLEKNIWSRLRYYKFITSLSGTYELLTNYRWKMVGDKGGTEVDLKLQNSVLGHKTKVMQLEESISEHVESFL